MRRGILFGVVEQCGENCVFIDAPLSLSLSLSLYIYIYIYIYTECPRRNGQNFGRVFLILNYTDITQNTYIQS